MNVINHRFLSVIIIPPPGLDPRASIFTYGRVIAKIEINFPSPAWPFPFQVVLDLDHAYSRASFLTDYLSFLLNEFRRISMIQPLEPSHNYLRFYYNFCCGMPAQCHNLNFMVAGKKKEKNCEGQHWWNGSVKSIFSLVNSQRHVCLFIR